VIVHNFDLVGVAFAPTKADSPLVIDADAVLPLSVALESFKPIARRHSYLPQVCGCVQRQQFASSVALDWMPGGNRRDNSARKIRSVSAHAKLTITRE